MFHVLLIFIVFMGDQNELQLQVAGCFENKSSLIGICSSATLKLIKSLSGVNLVGFDRWEQDVVGNLKEASL